MKIFKIAVICSCMMTLISTASFAILFENDEAGAPLEITSTDNDDFAFTPSPGTLMGIFTTEREFAMTVTSERTTTDNGIIYGIISTLSPIYQLDQAADGTNIPPTTAVSLPGAFVDKAGNEAEADAAAATP